MISNVRQGVVYVEKGNKRRSRFGTWTWGYNKETALLAIKVRRCH